MEGQGLGSGGLRRPVAGRPDEGLFGREALKPLLLDTHVLIWWLAGEEARFSKAARDRILKGRSTVFVSAAVAWEIAIKTALGKLDVPDNLQEVMAANRFKELPISIHHARQAGKLPPHHGDPFDRILIAQARAEKMVLVTADAVLHRYDVDTLNPAR